MGYVQTREFKFREYKRLFNGIIMKGTDGKLCAELPG